MTSHIVLPPRPVPGSGCFYAECTCGHSAIGETADEARAGMDGCREEARKAGLARDTEAHESRDRRRRLRREHRKSDVERRGAE